MPNEWFVEIKFFLGILGARMRMKFGILGAKIRLSRGAYLLYVL